MTGARARPRTKLFSLAGQSFCYFPHYMFSELPTIVTLLGIILRGHRTLGKFI